jgi:hypothetical protein
MSSSSALPPAVAAEGASPALDAARIVEVLARHGVDYLLIGGVAGRYHGAERLTNDLDSLARRDRDNLERVAAALRELDAFLRVGGVDDETAKALPVVVDGATLARLETSTWRTDAGDVDVLATIRDSQGRRLGIDDIEDRATTVVVVGVTVRLASLDDIIESKRFADRDKDREALPELERLRDERR